MTENAKQPHRGGLVWPVILIGAGVVFLLNNLGVLGWGVWETLSRLWPVLLIAIGLDILVGRRSVVGSVVVALLLVAVLAFAVWRGVPQWRPIGTANAVDRTETISEMLQGAREAEVEIGFGTGSLRLSALPEGSPELAKGTVDLSRDEQLEREHDNSSLVLRSQNAWAVGIRSLDAQDKVWDLALNRDIPLDLQISTGVGRSTLDLERLNLSALQVNAGVGETAVTLPRQGRLEVKINSGVGDLAIMIPLGMAARIEVNRGLGNLNVSGDFNRRDKEYISPNFDSAQNRIDLEVSGGLGRITIRQVEE